MSNIASKARAGRVGLSRIIFQCWQGGEQISQVTLFRMVYQRANGEYFLRVFGKPTPLTKGTDGNFYEIRIIPVSNKETAQ